MLIVFVCFNTRQKHLLSIFMIANPNKKHYFTFTLPFSCNSFLLFCKFCLNLYVKRCTCIFLSVPSNEISDGSLPTSCFQSFHVIFPVQPDRGAKRPREEDGGAAVGDENVRGGKHLKGLSARELARSWEAAEAGIDLRESDELREDRKKILEKLMDQDEDEPEVSLILNDE